MTKSKSKPKRIQTANKMSLCMITQQLDAQYWDMHAHDSLNRAIERLNAGDNKGASEVMADYIQNCFNSLAESGKDPNGKPIWIEHFRVDAVYAIIHDKDSREVYDSTQDMMVVDYKPTHLHAIVVFRKPIEGRKGLVLPTLDAIANLVGVAPQYVEKAGKGRFAKSNMLSYLIHAKDEKKYQYDANEVATWLAPGCDEIPYKFIYEQEKARWERGKYAKKNNSADAIEDEKALLEMLLEKLANGRITKNEILLSDEYYQVYRKNINKMRDAELAYMERRYARAENMVKEGTYKQGTIFVSGASGAGKSTYAKNLAMGLIADARSRGENWQIYNASAEHAFDTYAGQEVVILDDLRCYSMTPSDWLKLLDPYNVAEVSARYKNRGVVAKVLIITSVHSPESFFAEACRGRDEPIVQFIRRILLHAYVVKADEGVGSSGVLLRDLREDHENKAVRLVGYSQVGSMPVANFDKVPYYFDAGEWYGEKPDDSYINGIVQGYEADSYKNSPVAGDSVSDSIEVVLRKLSHLFQEDDA